jgi:hypothetical protein
MDMLFAFEKYFDDNSYDYLSLEEKMQSMQDLLEMIQNQA